jgi:hypothetical protein
LRAKGFLLPVCGLIIAVICGFATWWSIRIAIADWQASAGTIEGYNKALRIAPEDPELRAREALYRVDNDDANDGGQPLDDDLAVAARMNPYNSAVLMALGLRKEFQGKTADAESYLERAVAVDHQFKPAWTLANFYYRTHQSEKSWPLIERILHLEPLGFDPAPVFELSWNELEDTHDVDTDQRERAVAASRRIENMFPTGSERPVQYLQFLVNTKRVDAALDTWPKALAAYTPGGPGQASTMIDFADFLIANGRIPEAVRIWNQLAAHGILPTEPLNPPTGGLIADPEFQFPALGKAFGWRVEDVPGVFTGKAAGAQRFEISGDEPAMFGILSVIAPVLPGVPYRLQWKVDGLALSAPRDPGFAFQIIKEPGGEVTQCEPLLAANPPPCDFVSQADVKFARIILRYSRAQGTTRVSGVMQLRSVRLEPAR